MDSAHTPLRHVSLCFGYGGIDLGLKRAVPRIFGRPVVTIAACEIEAYAVANGLAKAEAGRLDPNLPFWTNLKIFPFGAFHGLVDILSAGFPCQPFSCAGRQQADSDPRHLWPYIRAGIDRMRPGIVFLENVEAIISAKLKGDDWSDPAGTPVLLHVLRELERLGYRAEAGIYSAEECGATHRRKRVFILAVDDSSNHGRERRGLSIRPGTTRQTPAGAWRPSQTVVHTQDTDGRRELESRAPKVRRPGFTGTDESLDNTPSGARFGTTPRSGGHIAQRCEGMANASVQGLQKPKHTELSGALRNSEGRTAPQFRRAQLPAYPPSPSDINVWARVLAIRPDLAPALSEAESALCGMADGNPHRVDQLRMCGNGVNPDTAERAFIELFKRLNS